MKFKLDENLSPELAEMFRHAGHDAATVAGEQAIGASDEVIFGMSVREGRCLVTLDLEFADPVRFPNNPAGIVVLRPRRHATLVVLQRLITDLLGAVERERLHLGVWIVEPGRIRIRSATGDGSGFE